MEPRRRLYALFNCNSLTIGLNQFLMIFLILSYTTQHTNQRLSIGRKVDHFSIFICVEQYYLPRCKCR